MGAINVHIHIYEVLQTVEETNNNNNNNNLGRFGQFLGWVVSALVGGSFRPVFLGGSFGPESFHSLYELLKQMVV